jgi:hypothetical protein
MSRQVSQHVEQADPLPPLGDEQANVDMVALFHCQCRM